MAWQDFAETLTVLEKKIVSDGMGGFEEKWSDGVQFKGTLRTSNSIQTLIAEQQGVKSVYVLLYPNNVPLRYGDVFKDKDRYYRISSEPKDGQTPKMSNLNLIQVTAEIFKMEDVV